MTRTLLAGLLLLFCSAPAAHAATRPEDGIPDTWKGFRWEQELKTRKWDPKAIEQLRRDKILITNEAWKQVFTPYLASEMPVFITSDSLLNAFHVLFEESVLRMEQANASRLPDILRFIARNLSAIDKIAKGKPELVAAAKKRALITIGTALRLLGDNDFRLDRDIDKIVAEEVKRVEAAADTAKPTWLGPPDDTFLALDYSRYKPRGFYTRSQDLSRYFRAVAWLQSIPFRVSRDEELLSILMMGNTITGEAIPDDPKGPDNRWEIDWFFRCYSHFVGAGDDWDLAAAADEAENPRDLDAEQLPAKREGLLEAAAKHGSAPQINDQVRFAPDDPTKAAEPNFRIISAYRTPDAILFHRTTDLRQFKRPFPAGLEVPAALGSAFARARLTDPDLPKLLATIDAAKPLFDGDNLYCKYLDCLAALVDKPEPDAPSFMTGEPWQIKSCQTALAGWAQIRHTWALQAKQTVEYLCKTMRPPGFVEPEPEFFARMAGLVRETADTLRAAGAFQPDLKGMAANLRSAATLLERKGAVTKGTEYLKEMDHEDDMVLEGAVELLFSYGSQPPERGDDAAYFRQLVKDMRTLAEHMDKGVVPAKAARFRLPGLGVAWNLEEPWRLLGELCLKLEALAHKQLRKAKLSSADREFILTYGETLARIMLYGGNSYLHPNDDAPRIIDVFSNPQEKKCLEVGIARARALYVIYPYDGGQVLCRGAVMPYYEFPNAERLTDATWKKLLDSDKRPPVPDWLKPIILGGNLAPPHLERKE